jgi:hypothetical protein
LLCKRSNQEKATADLALRVLTLRFSTIRALPKMEMNETELRSPRLQEQTVSQARSMLREIPASPQTTFISYPFSAKRKLQSPQRKVKVKSNGKVKTNVKANVRAIHCVVLHSVVINFRLG